MAEPTVITEGATNLTPSGSTLVGTCRSRGGISTVAWFEAKAGIPEYMFTTDSVDIPEDQYSFAINARTIHTFTPTSFRAVAANNDGTAYGEWLKFWVPEKDHEHEASPFYIMFREHEWEERQITLHLNSDVQTHLWVHISFHPPWKKRGFHFKRGRIFHHSPKVYWSYRWSVEQEEDGDVISHSFVFTFPPEYDTLWFQAVGNIASKHSPSRSPFFRYTIPQELYTLGIYGQTPTLEGHIFLEPGAGIVLSYDIATNTILVSDPIAPHRRARRHGYGHGRGPRNT